MNRYVEFLQTEIVPYFSSREKKPLRQQRREISELWARYRCIPYHYFKHRLYERSARPDFIDYLPANLIRHFRRTHNPLSHMRMLNDKLETIRALAGTGIRCAETMFSIDAGGMILRNDGAAVDADVAADALRRHGGMLFIKPLDSRGGYGASSLEAARVDVAAIKSMRNVLIQPVLRNHPIIEALHAGALNTMRICTFIEGGRCTIIAACLRVARGEAAVDNWTQGAIAVGIDLSSGALHGTGITKAEHGRRTYAVHPDTGARFASVTLPWWRETLEMARRAAIGLTPHVTLGLDIAITPQGPVFIEANGAGDLFGLQEACGPLGATLLGQRVLAHWLSTRGTRRHGEVSSLTR